jgi:predicted transcriptional regulator
MRSYIKQQSLAQLVQISEGRFYPLPKQLSSCWVRCGRVC